jgi:hypothetical protein
MQELTEYQNSSTTSSEWCPNAGPQTEALQRLEREIGYGGARGGGKTDAGMAWMVEPEYVAHSGYRGLVIRKHVKDLNDWISRAKTFFGDMAVFTGDTFTFTSGATITTGHLKDESAYEAYQGHEYQKILIEELTQIATEERYEKLISSCRSVSYPELAAQIFSTFNPGGIGHAWVKRRFVDCCNCKTFYQRGQVNGKVIELTRIFIPATVDDNPFLLKNDPAYILFLDTLPEQLRKAWRDGDWDVAMGQYFSNFGKHMAIEPFVIQPHESEGRLFAAMDYGYSLKGTSSFGLWYRHPNGKPYKLFTWTSKGLTGSQQADELYDYVTSFHWTSGALPVKVFADHNMFVNQRETESAVAPIEFFEKVFGGKVEWIKANKARVPGWQVVLNYFGRDTTTQEPNMYYFEKYNSAFEEAFPAMIHDPNNPDDVLKCDADHPCDETRYYLVADAAMKPATSHADKRIQAKNLQNEIAILSQNHGNSGTGW